MGTVVRAFHRAAVSVDIDELCCWSKQKMTFQSDSCCFPLDMSYTIYDYIQSYCFPQLQSKEHSFDSRSSSMTPVQLEQCIRDVRDFFSQRRLIYINDSSSNETFLFLSVSQLLWTAPARPLASNSLKPYFYPLPSSVQKSSKSFFLDLLQVKIQIEGKDLLNIIEQIKKKYGTKPIDKDDLTLLQNIYTLLIEQYSQVLTSNLVLYLPNVDGVLHTGSTLFFYPFEREQLCKSRVSLSCCGVRSSVT